MIQRKAKSRTVKLEDNFKYEPWKTAHMNLGRQIRGQTPTSGKPLIAKETANKLRILELAYLAEDRLAHTGKSTLPPKDQLKETIKGRATPMLLPDLVGWIWRWTSTPFQILGAFRSRFGGVFVKAVNKFTELKDSISKKVKEFFQQRAKHKGTGQSLVKALTVAIKQVVNILVPQTLSLVFQSVANGIKKKLDTLFDDSFVGKILTNLRHGGLRFRITATKRRSILIRLKKISWKNLIGLMSCLMILSGFGEPSKLAAYCLSAQNRLASNVCGP